MRYTGLCLFLAILTLNITVYAQDDGNYPDPQKRSGFLKVAQKIGSTIDSMTLKGVDRRYIEAPEKPWQVIVQGNVNQSDLKMKAVIDGEELFGETFGDITLEPRIKTKPSSYIGFWTGYRGYGIGYSRNVGGKEGSLFKFGAVGGSYGANLRIHNFKSDSPSIRMYGKMLDEWTDFSNDYLLNNPISVRTVFVDAYYLFNGKRFSYAAAYDQSVIQKKSVGSLMVGAMYFHSRVKYDNSSDADFIMLMNDVGKMKQDQMSFGTGYAYNLVPCKGLLVSTLAMPMITIYDKVSVWKYNSNIRDFFIQLRKNPDMEVFDDLYDYKIWQTDELSRHGKISFNFDARLSVSYNIRDWFICAYGQFSTFSYRHGSSKGKLNDWYVNASVGLRL